jgi:peptidoglycan/xylan/chitin deacetylase (PgdA/CDA1 family)
MYHSIGVIHGDWLWKYLTVKYQVFDHQMKILKMMGCHSIGLDELYNHMKNGEPLPPNSFVLTFDDGYADNWVAVAPILKKYGFKGTVYVNPEFVDLRTDCRKTLEDVWSGRCQESELEWKGFLSWEEIRNLSKGGVLDIQSHAMSHTWYFSDEEVIDYQHPGDKYIWMSWNNHPERKSMYMQEEEEQYKNYGVPIYKYGKSLQIRRYMQNVELDRKMQDYVRNNGGKQFFSKTNWKNELFEVYNSFKSNYPGRFETDQEMYSRYNYELRESKSILEKNIGKNVEYLCWPGGGYNEVSAKLGTTNYKSVVLNSLDNPEKKNIYGTDPTWMRRAGGPFISKGTDFEKMKVLGGWSLYLTIKSLQGSKSHNLMRKILKAWHLLLFKYFKIE